MATLTLIGEPFADHEAETHAEVARELTRAVALAAPRGCSSRLLIAAERGVPTFDTARARVERLPMRASALPWLWRTGFTARPLDGEFVHALTPLVPLRSRTEGGASQPRGAGPRAPGGLAPELMGSGPARQYRSFVKRAIRHADVVVTPTHATAEALQDRFGEMVVQVLPLAAPSGYLRPDDDEERRAALGLPARYLATTAVPGEIGRLEWLFSALEGDDELPPLVIIAGSRSAIDSELSNQEAPKSDPEPTHRIPAALRDRVHVVRPREVADIGTVLSGAELLVLPQQQIGAGYEVLGALASAVPVVHGGCAAVAELALDAGVAADTPGQLAGELTRLTQDGAELARLRVLAEDRSRSFNWHLTASMLWELHANI